MEDKIDCLLDMIPQESHFYYYFRGCWANGKEGTIADSNGHGIYRFYPFVKDEKGNRIDTKIDFDDYVINPIVAMGIIGYWLHYRKNNDYLASYTTWTKEDERKNTLKIFSDYTQDKLNQYIEREQYSPSSWRRDLEKEFYIDFIIRNEELLNEKTQALMEYITPSDQQQVKEVIAEYMLYLEEKRNAYNPIPKPEDGDECSSQSEVESNRLPKKEHGKYYYGKDYTIFHENLDVKKIVSAIKKLPRGKVKGNRKFFLTVYTAFTILHWLTCTTLTKFIAWMKFHSGIHFETKDFKNIEFDEDMNDLLPQIIAVFSVKVGEDMYDDIDKFYLKDKLGNYLIKINKGYD
jgi:hypothetical protein